MRLIFTILIFIVSATGYSQELTGIWRGTFTQRQINPYTGEWESFVYKYEVQINQINLRTIEGVTYSYKQKEFYGKAAFKGLFTKATKNVLLKETKMLELKTTENSLPCLMTCYFDYSKEGNVEKLKGTFSSIESPGHKDCGGGTISLQRVLHSDFKKEDFLANKPTALKSNTPSIHNSKSGVKNNTALIQHKPSQKSNVQSGTVISSQSSAKTPQLNDHPFENITASVLPLTPKKTIEDTIAKEMIIEKPVEIPFILKSRANGFIKTVIVNEKDITVDYYDNGEIDGDVISVYDNNKLMIDHDTLSTKPLRLNIHSDKSNAVHELITVAENLGSIPPNTCLMVITAGRQRLEIPMSSDEKTNAKVVIEYQPSERTKITMQN